MIFGGGILGTYYSHCRHRACCQSTITDAAMIYTVPGPRTITAITQIAANSSG